MGEVRLLTGMAVLHYDNLCIDPNQRRVYVNGRVIKMTTMEFNILYYLASHPGWTFTREQLYQYAMPDDFAAVFGSGENNHFGSGENNQF